MEKLGFAGRLALTFLNSKLTPLIIVASLLLGALAILKTPREEEPQIIVPMADIFVQMPGATSKEVEQRVTSPMEKLAWEIPGVEYVYSTSSPGQSMVVVRFLVGQDEERALVRLREKLQSHSDLIPAGASGPIIKPRSIDDVPILALTLHSSTVNAFTLRQISAQVEQSIKSVPDVSETLIIGGPKRELRIEPDPAKMASAGVDVAMVTRSLGLANTRVEAGQFDSANSDVKVTAGRFLDSASQIRQEVVGLKDGTPVRVSDIAQVVDGPEQPNDYVLFGFGRASKQFSSDSIEPAVTISVAKRRGVNAVDVVHAVLAKVETLKGSVIPGDVEVSITRNYGETSAGKSNELLFHMGIAVVSVTLLIAIALGRRESLVVLITIPVTLALTLLVFYLIGFTLNRITLFALIFSVGILVDDAIVVVENIVRHLRMPEARTLGIFKSTVRAVDEVGNPTILATFAVIAAILPMAFVGGLMGPYMRPIPVGASAAMVFSLLIAFVVTPWAAVRILRESKGSKHASTEAAEGGEGGKDVLTRLYRRIMNPLLRSPLVRSLFFLMVGLLFAGSIALVAFKVVTVKMLPFDNKNEFQIIVDMPNGTTLEQTTAVARAIGAYTSHVPEVLNYQVYAGTASPYNFNGLVRHYFDRTAPYQADVQVNLTDRGDRAAQSHDIVKRIRPDLEAIARRYGARLKLAEVPPGPPVLETLVAEVYGPDEPSRLAVAKQVKTIFSTTTGVSDVDWFVDDDQPTTHFRVDAHKAALAGVSVSSAAGALATSLSGQQVGLLHIEDSREPIPVVLRSALANRSGIARLAQVNVVGNAGDLIPLSDLVVPDAAATDKSIYHKNLLPVTYITGDVVGKQESPVYAISKMNEAIDKLRLPSGAKINVLSTHLPEDTTLASMKWDGEWQITYEVFRDLGIAFAAVLVLIYVLVVGWFQNFKTPLVIMAPIPLTLVGILPGHALMGAFFSATSMIGFIAGAGIIVRNSIILVDFIELRRREGSTLEQAVVDAGAVRFRPMLLTAAAVIVGSFVILFDPIFQGLAIALMAGEIASTLLSRLAVPVLYYLSERRGEEARVRAASTS